MLLLNSGAFGLSVMHESSAKRSLPALFFG